MFVYIGKLTWESPKIEDETFVIALPNGAARVGDTAYLFTQYTNGSRGVKNSNWFQNLVIEKVTKNKSSGEDTFSFKHHTHSYEIKSQDHYGKLNATISKGHSKTSTSLKRIYEPHGEEHADTVRVWTGKFDWLHFAKNELAIFIAPEGLGEGRPIVSVWQYTEDSAGKKKDPSSRVGVQKLESGAAKGTVKFSYHSYYDITCTWDQATDRLAVQMSENGGAKVDVGNMIMSAKIERASPTTSAHSFYPPEPTPKKQEFEVRLPQVEDSLPRILAPMPFPKGIVETLTHAAAYVDQAGYLAKYAQDRFTALDGDFQKRGAELAAANKANAELKDDVKKLTAELLAEKNSIEKLKKLLEASHAEAKKEREEFQAKVDKFTAEIAEDAKEDMIRLDKFNMVSSQLLAATAEIGTLKTKLHDEELKSKGQEAELEKRSKTITAHEGKIHGLESDLAVKKGENTKLSEEKAALQTAKDQVDTNYAALTKKSAKTEEKLKEHEVALDEKEDELVAAVKKKAEALTESIAFEQKYLKFYSLWHDLKDKLDAIESA